MSPTPRLALFLGLALELGACATVPAPSARQARLAPAGVDPQFARFVEDYFAAHFAASPSAATSAGLHQYDDRLEDCSKEAMARHLVEQHAFLERLMRFDRAKLHLDDQIDAAAIEGQLRADLLDGESLRSWAHNPMSYVSLPGGAIDGLMKRDFAPARERLRALVARLERVPAVYAALRANIETPPREFTELSIRMAKGSIGFYRDQVASFAREAAGTDQALLRRFTAANERALSSVTELTAWLEKDLLPRSTGRYAIGEKAFLDKLRYEEHVELPLAELLARGEARLEADHAAFLATARAIDPSRPAGEVMHVVSSTHPTAADLIPSVRRSVDDARSFLVAKNLATVPSEVRPKIEETPPYDRAGSFASMDTAGPFENRATESFYYVTPVEADWDAAHQEEHLRGYNPWTVALVNVHEAYPGHYLQFLWASRYPTRTRQILGVSSNAEGWAHYSEQMMVDEGFGGGDPRFRLAQLQEALLRDTRYVVGIKLHTAGWTVEDGARLFRDKAFLEPANALEESRRGTYNPTYLYYTLGKLEILRLREEYLARGHTLRQFHDAFVSQGCLPIPLLRKLLLATPAAK